MPEVAALDVMLEEAAEDALAVLLAVLDEALLELATLLADDRLALLLAALEVLEALESELAELAAELLRVLLAELALDARLELALDVAPEGEEPPSTGSGRIGARR